MNVSNSHRNFSEAQPLLVGSGGEAQALRYGWGEGGAQTLSPVGFYDHGINTKLMGRLKKKIGIKCFAMQVIYINSERQPDLY